MPNYFFLQNSLKYLFYYTNRACLSSYRIYPPGGWESDWNWENSELINLFKEMFVWILLAKLKPIDFPNLYIKNSSYFILFSSAVICNYVLKIRSHHPPYPFLLMPTVIAYLVYSSCKLKPKTDYMQRTTMSVDLSHYNVMPIRGHGRTPQGDDLSWWRAGSQGVPKGVV